MEDKNSFYEVKIMYYFLENIRIRTCDELSFFVDISNNNLIMIKTKTLKYLELKMRDGLSIEGANALGTDFIQFINELKNQNILGVTTDEI